MLNKEEFLNSVLIISLKTGSVEIKNIVHTLAFEHMEAKMIDADMKRSQLSQKS